MTKNNFRTGKILHQPWLPTILAVCCMAFTSSVLAFDGNYAVFGDDDGNIYRLNKTGSLVQLSHTARLTGEPLKGIKPVDVTPNGNLKAAFTNVDKIFSGGDGIIYVINNQGQLIWTRHDGRYGATKQWNQGRGLVIARGWDSFERVFSGGDGIIYAISRNGKMRWYQHYGWLDGSRAWAKGSGQIVSRGWQGTINVFSGGNGVIYSIMPSGRVRWHLHKGRLTGTEDWANQGIHNVVGFNWSLRHAFSGGDGIVYATGGDGSLNWYRHTEWLSGKEGWAAKSGQVVYPGLVNRQ